MRGLPIKKLDIRPSWEGWHFGMLERILDATSNLQSLTMKEDLNKYNRMKLRTGEALERYLSVLSQFPHLQELRLPSCGELDMGFDGGAECGNAYFGPDGREYGRSETRRCAETSEEAAKMVHDALPNLARLAIGSHYINITLNGRGTSEMAWAWTGRMEEHLYEVWPEYDDNGEY
jgi:hypothetical protein